jgi:hypothetical protein
MERRITVSVLVAALGLAAWLTTAPAALATIEGPCQGSIAGENVAPLETEPRSEPVKVGKNARVPVTMTSARPITHLTVELEFGGIGWTVHDAPTEGTSWAKVVNVKDYSKYGVGLYKIVGKSTSQGFSCTGAALVEVEGEPLKTPAGIAALAATIIGAIGVLRLAFRRRASGAAPVFGAVFGVLLGAGVAVLLQQFSIVYPTLIVALVALGGGVVLGILSGLWGQRTGPAY